MRIAIHQPQYLPWLGYFDKMDRSEIFVILDDVQYKKNEWQNRNKIRNARGWQWLTVPVKHRFGQKIKEITIDHHGHWAEKHYRGIELNYSNAPFFSRYASELEGYYREGWDLLVDLNIFFIEFFRRELGIGTELVKSSELGLQTSSTRRLVEICEHFGGSLYISGAGGRDYLDVDMFRRSGIKLEFQEYHHPRYRQIHGGFHPYMSVMDLLLNEGDRSLDIIRGGRGQEGS